ncbi:hypothetical protein TNCV_104121 [Trichonephila clavipes]|nr:hypothetical protein TNCV_104121 [Trichonephila clavipes]
MMEMPFGFEVSSPNTRAPEFSPIFCSFCVPVGRVTAFDGEIAASHSSVLSACPLEKFTTAAIPSDFRAALLAIISDNNPITQDMSSSS